jgi:hypothetical protein
LSFRARARSANSRTSPAMSTSDFNSAARTIGVIKAFSVATQRQRRHARKSELSCPGMTH